MKQIIDFLSIDFSNPTDTLIKTATYLGVGTGMEYASFEFIPSILMEIVKFTAYLGASTAFFKWVGGLLFGKKSKTPEE